MLLWMAAGVSQVWHHSWQPLVAPLRVPEIAPILGGSCVMSQATFWQEQWASVKEAIDPEGDIYLIIGGSQLWTLGLHYKVCSGAWDHPNKALCPTPTKENSLINGVVASNFCLTWFWLKYITFGSQGFSPSLDMLVFPLRITHYWRTILHGHASIELDLWDKLRKRQLCNLHTKWLELI